MTTEVAPKRGNGLGVASLVLGIIAAVLAIIPFVGLVAFLVGGVGLILGLIGLFLKGRKRGTAIAGVILAIASFIIAGVMTGGSAAVVDKAIEESESTMEDTSSGDASGEEASSGDESSEEASSDESGEAAEESGEDVPTEYKSALTSAESYSDTMHMSKAAIFDQLTSEVADQFSEEAAQYAIDNIEADWKENALKSAENYQETMSMSPEAIRDQLVSEHGDQFTQEQADYAVENLE